MTARGHHQLLLDSSGGPVPGNFVLLVKGDPGAGAGVTFGYYGNVGSWAPITGTKSGSWYPGRAVKVASAIFVGEPASSGRMVLGGDPATLSLTHDGYSPDGGVTGGGVNSLFDGTYVFRGGGGVALGRSTNNGASFTNPSASATSFNHGIVKNAGVLYGVRATTRRTIGISADDGATWSAGGNIRASSPTGRMTACIDVNPNTGMLVAGGGYTGAGGYLSYGSNPAVDLTAATYPFSGVAATIAVKWITGTRWVAFDEDGSVAYSSDDGATWTLVSSVEPITTGYIDVATDGNRIIATWEQTGAARYSDDFGASWSSARAGSYLGVVLI